MTNRFSLSLRLFPFILCAPTIIEITNLRAIKERLLQRLVDLVVNMTCPSCCRGACFNLGREFIQDLAEVAGTFSARKSTVRDID